MFGRAERTRERRLVLVSSAYVILMERKGKETKSTDGLRARSLLREAAGIGDHGEGSDHKDEKLVGLFARCRLMAASWWSSAFRICLLLLLISAIATACIFLPVEKILKDFLLWVKHDLGPWGPIILAFAYIPLTVLAVPASVLTLGGGYLFGLPLGFIADSIGATMGATAAFVLGRTIGRSYVIAKLKDYPKFQAVAIAIQRSGFKIILLLRLVPLLPFNIMNYLLSVTPISIGEYMLASWLGMMPITFALVYIGTTLKDLSDISHGWNEVSTSRWVFIALGFGISVILLVCIIKIAKASLEKALAENARKGGMVVPSILPIVADKSSDVNEPLIVKIDQLSDK